MIEINFEVNDKTSSIDIICTAKCCGKTGVEMEALTGASIASLTIYDMCKSVDKTMKINSIYLVSKTGGKSDYKS
jgi:cyclic pyranopterin phosphate synthase